MKRLLTSIIALLYFTISTGLVMNVHYCMGELSSVKVNQAPAETCVCGMSLKETSSKGCCKTEFTVIKLEDNHKASYASFDFQTPEILLSRTISLLEVSTFQLANKVYADIHGPPLLSEQDTYLLNCVFRI